MINVIKTRNKVTIISKIILKHEQHNVSQSSYLFDHNDYYYQNNNTVFLNVTYSIRCNMRYYLILCM